MLWIGLLSLATQASWADVSEVKLLDRKAQTVVLKKQTVNINQTGTQVGKSILELRKQLQVHKIEPLDAPFERRVSKQGDNYVFEVGFPVRPKTVLPAKATGLRLEKIPAGKALGLTIIGPYTQFREAADKMQAALKTKKLTAKGSPLLFYATNPEGTSPDKQQTDVVQPVR